MKKVLLLFALICSFALQGRAETTGALKASDWQYCNNGTWQSPAGANINTSISAMKFNDDFTADFTKKSSNNPGYYNSGSNFRFYSKDYFTIKPTNDGTLITKIIISHESIGGYNI